MSGLLMPVLAIGGIVVLGNYLTKKNKKDDEDSSSSSSSSSSSTKSRKHKKHKSSKTKKEEPKTASILKVNKTKKKEDTSIRKVYVFYKVGAKRGNKWRYHKLPKGWVVKNKKNITSDDYSKQVQFQGPKSERDAMIKYLEKAFEFLKTNDYVKKYKISKEAL